MIVPRSIRRLLGWPEPPTLESAKNAADIRTATLAHLRTHRKWYVRWSRLYSVAWNATTLLIIILGALSSILTASKPQLEVPSWLLITLPALSSLLGAILVQFRLKEACRLREIGRIKTEELICKAYLIPTNDDAKAMQAAIELREYSHQLERDQLNEFLAEPPRVGQKADSAASRTSRESSDNGNKNLVDKSNSSYSSNDAIRQ